MPPTNTTLTSGSTSVATTRPVPVLVLVIVWYATEPHRVGEVAPFPIYQTLYVGRWDEELKITIEEFARFAHRRPGAVLAADPLQDALKGKALSRPQLIACASASHIRVQNVGKCVMFVNGVETKEARLGPGDVLRLQGELVLYCTRRLIDLPAPGAAAFIPTFGEPDAWGMIGESEAMWALRALIDTVGPIDENVFVTGESGSGKELVANAIHQRSRRANAPFVARNTASFTDTLIESALFGNDADYPNKGMKARTGIVTEADGGTVFLDEIGDSKPEVQAQLLRAMDPKGECNVQGRAKPVRVNVRFIAATNRPDIRGEFRARLPIEVPVPPLRERREDIPLLLRHWLLERARKAPEEARRFVYAGPSGRPEVRISSRLIEYFMREPFPFNVRELLEGRLLAATHRSRGDKVEMFEVPQEPSTIAPPPASEGQREGEQPSADEERIRAVLDQERGNVTKAAEVLGMERSALNRRMRALGIKRKE